MNNWIRKTDAKVVLLQMAAFECSKCKNVVIVVDGNTDTDAMPRIENYKFCPYCGEKMNCRGDMNV